MILTIAVNEPVRSGTLEPGSWGRGSVGGPHQVTTVFVVGFLGVLIQFDEDGDYLQTSEPDELVYGYVAYPTVQVSLSTAPESA